MSGPENSNFLAATHRTVNRVVERYHQSERLRPGTLLVTNLASRLACFGLLIHGGNEIIGGNIGQGVVEVLAGLKSYDITDWTHKQLMDSTSYTYRPLSNLRG